MAHLVICTVCGKRFDRDRVQAVKTGARRYAHYKCAPDKELVPLLKKEEDPDLTKLKEYITEKYGDRAKWPLINKQIKKFTTDNGYSLSGILKSLVWFYDVKGNSVEGSNGGIGICEYCYQDAYNYYYNLFLAQNQNQDKDIPRIISKVKEVEIPLPKIVEKKRFFNLDDDEVAEDE